MTAARIDKKTLKFLARLKRNNNRDWFNAHKSDYQAARDNFADFVGAVIERSGEFDPSIDWLTADDCLFRIYRDMRFSRDKTPYKSGLGAHLVANGDKVDKGLAGYYLHIEPGATRIACGAYRPPATWLKAIRHEIIARGDSFDAIVDSRDFNAYFGELRGEALKTVPRGFDKQHPQADWLKRKGFLAYHAFTDDQVTADDFVQQVVDGYRLGFRLIEFLNAALPDGIPFSNVPIEK